jgi:hypothetical protein
VAVATFFTARQLQKSDKEVAVTTSSAATTTSVGTNPSAPVGITSSVTTSRSPLRINYKGFFDSRFAQFVLTGYLEIYVRIRPSGTTGSWITSESATLDDGYKWHTTLKYKGSIASFDQQAIAMGCDNCAFFEQPDLRRDAETAKGNDDLVIAVSPVQQVRS